MNADDDALALEAATQEALLAMSPIDLSEMPTQESPSPSATPAGMSHDVYIARQRRRRQHTTGKIVVVALVFILAAGAGYVYYFGWPAGLGF